MIFSAERRKSAVGKLFESLAINYSLPRKIDIFVSRFFKLSYVLVILQLAWVHTSPQLCWIARSGLALFPICQGSCGIVSSGLASSVVSFNTDQGSYVLACSFDIDFNYVTTMLQQHLFLNH